MKLKLLTDENISLSTLRELRVRDYDVEDIKEEKLQGISDNEIVKIAAKEHRIIITLDKDFGNLLLFPPPLKIGVILIDLRFPKPDRVNRVLCNFLKGKKQEYLDKKLFLIDEVSVRIRG